MSETKTDSQRSGRRRQGSRGGQGRSNNNRNRNRSRNRNRNREGQGGQNRGDRQPRRRPEPIKLTLWQKILKALGLYKEPTRSGGRTAAGEARVRNKERNDGGSPRQRREKSDRGDRERKTPEQIEPDSNRLYLGNLSYEATESDLEELFKGIGTVRSVEIVYNRRTHRSKGYGFIEMLSVDDAKRAVEVLHDQFFMGRKLLVSGAKSKGEYDADDERARQNDRDEEEAESRESGSGEARQEQA